MTTVRHNKNQVKQRVIKSIYYLKSVLSNNLEKSIQKC